VARYRREIEIQPDADTGAEELVGAPAGRTLDFTVDAQVQSQWCWSAVATSVCRYYDASTNWTQCSLADAEFGQTSCCRDGSTTDCNKPHTLDTALRRTGNLKTWYPVAFQSLETEIQQGRLVAARVAWRGGGGHVVVIDGYLGDPQQTIAVSDPSPIPSAFVPLQQFADSYRGFGVCTHIYETTA
jgi:hypothetical protein